MFNRLMLLVIAVTTSVALSSCVSSANVPGWRTDLIGFIEHMEEVQIGWTKSELQSHAGLPDELSFRERIWVYTAFEGGRVAMAPHDSKRSAVYRFFFESERVCRFERLAGHETAKRYGWNQYHTWASGIPSGVLDVYNRAIVAFRNDNYEEAAAALETLHKTGEIGEYPWVDSDRRAILMLLAESYARIEQHAEALKVFGELLKKYEDHPRMPSLYKAMGDAYYMTGEEERAKSLWKAVEKQNSSFSINERIKHLVQEKQR